VHEVLKSCKLTAQPSAGLKLDRDSHGTLDQLEEALGHEAPIDALDHALCRATRKSAGQKENAKRPVRHVCADCGKVFPREKPLQPIERFWQRVEAGEIVPSGQCPECGALCYLERGETS